MKGGSGIEDDDSIVAEINMIPLIDVSLVLLIIFMVLTPVLVRSQIKVDLPSSSTSKPSPDDPLRFDIKVDKSGAVFLGDQPMSVGDLSGELIRRAGGQEDAVVVVSADKTVVFETVVHVMDEVKKAGLTKIGIGVVPERGSAQK